MSGPEVMRPVGWRIEPEFGPDRTDPLLCWEEEERRERGVRVGSRVVGVVVRSNILPSSPEVLMSPPV